LIARTWHGRVPLAKSDEYLRLMREVAIPDYRKTPGNRGAYALRRLDGDKAHFLMLTFWGSEKDIEAFAGSDVTKARYYPGDEDYLLELEDRTQHYEVIEG